MKEFNSSVILEPHFSGKEKSQRLLSKLIKVAVTMILFSAIPEIYYVVVESLFVIGMTLVIFAVAYYLNSEGHTEIAANILILSLSLLLFVQTLQLGTSSYTAVYYLPLVTGVPFIINPNKRWLFLFHLVHVSVLCSLTFIIEDIFFQVEVDKNFTDLNGPINMLCSLFMTAFFMWSMIQDNVKSQKILMIAKQKLEHRNDSLTKINQELDHLVYSISHDLRAPVATALGLIELSKLETDEDKLKYYEGLKENCLKRLDNFILDILNYLKNNRLDISIEEINLNEEINFAIQMNTSFNTEVKVLIEPISVVGFYSDKNRIRIILNNLLSNAFRYARNDGQPKYIRIYGSYEENMLRLSIEDNGVGIHTEYLDKIFMMFFKTDEKSKGSGIGLYITKEAINKLQGDIAVESQKNVGTTFTIMLPNLESRKKEYELDEKNLPPLEYNMKSVF
ncbi:MAG: HAMP domain-containing sensor histidine kinase [Cytophagaceae bacterium]